MLSTDYLRRTLSELREFGHPETQILQGSGFDGVIELLDSLRSVEFPCVVLEAGGSGNVQLIEGPVDTYTQSVWVMGRLGRSEDEATLYAEMKELARKITAKLLQDAAARVPEAAAIDWNRYAYMQRYGGQNARGYELLFTLREDFSLLLKPEDFKPKPVKIFDYLYGVDFYDLDYRLALSYFKSHGGIPAAGACSAVGTGTIFGGNLDWFYDNGVEFAVRTPAKDGRLATMGVSGIISELTRDAVENQLHPELYPLIPFHLNDGINQYGVFCKVNVVPNDKGKTSKSIPEGEQLDEICSTMLVRFVLDRFSSAQQAVDYLRQHVSIYHPAKLQEMGYEAHWMIADQEHSYVVEIVENRIVVTESAIMTNFFLDGVTFNPDGSVWTPADVPDGHLPSENGITAHGSGLERHNFANALLPLVYDKEGMRALMSALLYSKTYLSAPVVADPVWHTEYVGNLTVDNPPADFEEVEARYAEIFRTRDRNTPASEPRTWHSSHSSVYDAVSGKLYVVSQEDLTNECEITLMNG